MVESLLNAVGALRWELPVRSPADQNVADQGEAAVIDATGDLVRETPLEFQRRGSYDVPNGADGDGTPAYSLSSGEVDGRAAVAAARRPESP